MNGFMRCLLALLVTAPLSSTAFALGSAPKPDRPIDTRPLAERIRGPVAGAHQGGMFQDHVVNTIGVFQEAYGEGVDIVEMDLQVTRDGHAVVFHDGTLEGISNCRGKVGSFTLEEISKCTLMTEDKAPAPAPEDAIPPFRSVLNWSGGKVVINAEFKTLESIAPALAAVRAKNAYEWVFFQTKSDPARYELARKLDPKVYLLFAANDPEQLEWALSLDDPRLLVIEIDKRLRKPEYIDAIHQAGKLVLEDTWHFRKDFEILNSGCKDAFALGIDIGISNQPAKCAKQRDRVRAAMAGN